MLFAIVLATVLLADQVDMRDPQQRLVLNVAELQRLCGAHGRYVFACTFFEEETLECHCRENQSLWYPAMTAHLSPVMLLSRPDYASHEWLHLNDIHFRLHRWIGEEEAVGYASAPDCERAGNAKVASFAELMNGFRQESNAQYH
jgi:hypothetical protein